MSSVSSCRYSASSSSAGILLDLLFISGKYWHQKLEPTPGILSRIMVLVSVQVSRVISYLPHGSRRQEGHQDLANDLSSDVGYRVQSSLVPRKDRD